LAVEIMEDGGVRIAGTAAELCALASWLLSAAAHGHAQPSYVTDEALTVMDIMRIDLEEP
jgi:hypothetical protein